MCIRDSYSAIQNHVRPCERACKVKAIQQGENHVAHIDDSKCIACGACVYQCPFGAIQDLSLIHILRVVVCRAEVMMFW